MKCMGNLMMATGLKSFSAILEHVLVGGILYHFMVDLLFKALGEGVDQHLAQSLGRLLQFPTVLGQSKFPIRKMLQQMILVIAL